MRQRLKASPVLQRAKRKIEGNVSFKGGFMRQLSIYRFMSLTHPPISTLKVTYYGICQGGILKLKLLSFQEIML